jgi:tRNA A-37 threonylcarbamoyl transferase component Bud32
VVKNITAVFNAIHELGVIHGDVRRQNIMVKADQSVVIIDFEISRRERVSATDIESEDDIVEDLLIELLGDRSPCSGSGSLDGTVTDDTLA